MQPDRKCFLQATENIFCSHPKWGPKTGPQKLGPKIGPRGLIAGLKPTVKRRGKWWRFDQLFRLPKGHRRAQTRGKTTGEMVAIRPTLPVAERSSPGSNPRQNDGGNGGESTNFSGCRKVIAGLKPTAKRRGKWWRFDQLFRLPKGHRRAQTHGKTTGEMVMN